MVADRTQSQQSEAEVLTVQEVADYLRVTTKTVYGLARGGDLVSFRVGRAMRFRRSDIEAFVGAQLDGPSNGMGSRHDFENGNRVHGESE